MELRLPSGVLPCYIDKVSVPELWETFRSVKLFTPEATIDPRATY